MAKKTEAEPWERQPGESTKAFEAFCNYRDAGAARSINRTVRTLPKNRTTIAAWSAKYEWVNRCAEWDAEQDRIIREQQIEEIKKMRKRHADVANAMIIKAAQALQNIPKEEIKAQDISRMVEVASKLERLSRGDVGEVVEERQGEAIESVKIYIPANNRDSTEEEE